LPKFLQKHLPVTDMQKAKTLYNIDWENNADLSLDTEMLTNNV
jgi:hypothetical protein